MSLRVEIDAGTAYEVLIAAGVVADPDWRDTFTAGPSTYDRIVERAGAAFAQQVRDVGRLGWINLLGLMVDNRRSPSLNDLVRLIAATKPADLHFAMVGGRRKQLRDLIDMGEMERALAVEGPERAALAAALSSDETVLSASPWLLESPSVDVHARVVDALATWRERVLPEADEGALARELETLAADVRARAASIGGEALFAQVTSGVQYAPPGLERVTLIVSPMTAPVLVFVDGIDSVVVAHPPLATEREAADVAARLAELGRAVGDKTRIALLSRLGQGPTTAVELAEALAAPRTTLLHHLAILRAAGLIEVRVTAGDATVYRLLPQGFDDLAQNARAFIGLSDARDRDG